MNDLPKIESCEMSPHYYGKYEYANGKTIILEPFKESKALLESMQVEDVNAFRIAQAAFFKRLDEMADPWERLAWIEWIKGIAGVIAGDIPNPFKK